MHVLDARKAVSVGSGDCSNLVFFYFQPSHKQSLLAIETNEARVDALVGRVTYLYLGWNGRKAECRLTFGKLMENIRRS